MAIKRVIDQREGDVKTEQNRLDSKRHTWPFHSLSVASIVLLVAGVCAHHFAAGVDAQHTLLQASGRLGLQGSLPHAPAFSL